MYLRVQDVTITVPMPYSAAEYRMCYHFFIIQPISDLGTFSSRSLLSSSDLSPS